MNLSVPNSATTSESNPAISTYSILLLSGVLFGMCISDNMTQEVKTWMVLAGTLGLVAYLVGHRAAQAQAQAQQRIATMQVEERLDRHSHLDLRAEDLRLDQPEASSTRG